MEDLEGLDGLRVDLEELVERDRLDVCHRHHLRVYGVWFVVPFILDEPKACTLYSVYRLLQVKAGETLS